MKYLKLILLFATIVSSIYSAPQDASKIVFDFAGLLLKDNYEVRDLKNVKPADKTSYTFQNKEYFLYTGTGAKDSEFSISTKFYVGWDYIIIGAGDSNSSDIDIYVYDENSTLVAVDRNVTPHSFPLYKSEFIDPTLNPNNNPNIEKEKISIRPLKSSTYTIKIKIRTASTPTVSWSMLIASKRNSPTITTK